ncbi:MAG: DUF58 domain-containing protein, partial [Cyanobacteria bacterium P01_H01_bin.121]
MQYRLNRRCTPRGLAVSVCLLVAATIGLDTNQTLAYQIFTFLTAVVMIAIAACFSFRDRFTVQRRLPRFGTVGILLKYRIVIQNQSQRGQVGLQLRENFADLRPDFDSFMSAPEPRLKNPDVVSQRTGYARWLSLIARTQRAIAKPIDLPLLQPARQTDVWAILEPTQRGRLEFTGITLARPDPFGLFNALQLLAVPQSLWVLPKRYQLPSLNLPGWRRYQSGGVALASSVADSEEFRSLRDYRPGDPLRKIHWKSWAKTGEPVVREEQDEFFVRHALILDTFVTPQNTPQHIEVFEEVFEEAISVAASFACDFQTQESLLDLMFVGLEAHIFTVGRSVGHSDRMLEILAAVK